MSKRGNGPFAGLASTMLLPFDLDWLKDTAKRLDVGTADVLEELVRQAQRDERKTGLPFTPSTPPRTRCKNFPEDPKRVQDLQRQGIYEPLEKQRARALQPYLELIGVVKPKMPPQ